MLEELLAGETVQTVYGLAREQLVENILALLVRTAQICICSVTVSLQCARIQHRMMAYLADGV